LFAGNVKYRLHDFVLSVLALLIQLLHFTYTYKLCTVTLHLSQRAGCFACSFLANSETCGTFWQCTCKYLWCVHMVCCEWCW